MDLDVLDVLHFEQHYQTLILKIVAINDLTDANMLAHLLKYDTVHGTLAQEVTVDGEYLVVEGHKVKVYRRT